MRYVHTLLKSSPLPIRKILQLAHSFRRIQRNRHLPEMDPTPVEGYTDKPFYLSSETARFYIKSQFRCIVRIERIVAPYTYKRVDEIPMEATPQKSADDPAVNGCRWEETFSLPLADYTSGYYRAVLQSENAPETYITFIVQETGLSSDVVVVAPISTWLAYNPYGGKSAYDNVVDFRNVHRVSNQRPNTALQYDPEGGNIHDMNVEVNIYYWFSKYYKTTIVPDTYLERDLPELHNAQVWVLAYHCEYVSFEMRKKLDWLIKSQQKSLVNLGGNQVYWKIRYHDNEREMEVRKDCSLFTGTLRMGGLWRDTLRYGEERLFGVRYTDPGAGTYAPYKVLIPDHWLFKGRPVYEGEIFGNNGINSIPICGDETDNVVSSRKRGRSEVVARGLNCSQTGNHDIVYPDGRYKWNGKGGGDIALKTFGNRHGCLSTGSIQSGSGLGPDEVLTTIVRNFTDDVIRGEKGNRPE